MTRKETPPMEDKGLKKDESPSTQALYQQLLTCLKGSWRSLVVVPAQPGLSAKRVASALVDVAGLVRGASARLFDAEGLELAGASRLIVEMTTHVEAGGLAVVCLESVVRKPAGIPLALAADAALLVVHLGLSSTEDAKKTMALIGEEKFLGAVTLEQERP